MQIIRDIAALGGEIFALRGDRGQSVALVPTMGALHAGHLALVAEARTRADRVVATIFVNPLQFGRHEDFGRYPRSEARDLAMLEEAGCDLVWVPRVEDMYPEGFATRVRVAGLSDKWEGEARPGHFDGVATVVAKLLIAVRPDIALFGEKDFQQLAVIRRLAADLHFGVEIVAVPTVREEDGLALSSRNVYLSAAERSAAAALPKALAEASRAISGGSPVAAALARARDRLAAAGFGPIDYVALVDPATMEPVEKPGGAMRLIAAATIGTTRLIDNVAVEMDSSPRACLRR